MKDMKGFAFNEGCKVARAVLWGKSPMIEICIVTKIKETNYILMIVNSQLNFPSVY